MFSYPERFLALRYMRAKRREGFVSIITAFSVLGITLGVATLILVTSLMNGIREEMTANFVGVDGHITIYGPGRYVMGSDTLLDELQAAFAANNDIESMSERIEGQVMVTSAGRSLGAQVMGLHAEDLAKKARMASSLSQGALSAYREGKGVIVGSGLLRNLGLRVGDPLTLISPQGRATIAGVVPRIKSYPVVGTFTLGMHAIDSSLVLLPFADAQTYFALPAIEGGIASALEITLKHPENVEKLAADIQHKLQGRALRILDWKQTNASVFTALQVQQRVMIVILALIILVAAFNIISSLIMLVQDKSREIAILRSMGATRGMVLRIFMLAGMGIGLAGTFAGVALGWLGATYLDAIRRGLETVIGQPILIENIYFLSSLPTKTDPAEVLGIVLLAVLLSFFSTLYPAWKAASYEPAESLRYD
ncbi:MAG: lipoprotein-releasing ABC transporter permease subunit [Rickettsiales bacterium]|nr:lipoprotein-releasing ABC transporter permease subunit [Rickettsiales bacterium]